MYGLKELMPRLRAQIFAALREQGAPEGATAFVSLQGHVVCYWHTPVPGEMSMPLPSEAAQLLSDAEFEAVRRHLPVVGDGAYTATIGNPWGLPDEVRSARAQLGLP